MSLRTKKKMVMTGTMIQIVMMKNQKVGFENTTGFFTQPNIGRLQCHVKNENAKRFTGNYDGY